MWRGGDYGDSESVMGRGEGEAVARGGMHSTAQHGTTGMSVGEALPAHQTDSLRVNKSHIDSVTLTLTPWRACAQAGSPQPDCCSGSQQEHPVVEGGGREAHT